MNREEYLNYMGKRILRRAMKKRNMDGMMCCECLNLNRCYDVCEAIDKEQFIIACSNFRGKKDD